MTRLSEDDYDALAGAELHALVDALDALEASLPSGGFEAELEAGVLTLDIGGARYVVNSHRAARQIWLAAERTAWHFDWDDARRAWIASRNGDELWTTLAVLLEKKLGHPVSLRRPA
jgi:CyaY protein